MKHRVLPVLFQVVLIAAAVSPAQAQSQLIERINKWQALSHQASAPLSAANATAQQYGISGVLRQLWDGGGWMAESRTTHSYNGLVRYQTVDDDWAFVQWMPTSRTTYRPDGLVETVEQWDAGSSAYTPGTRFTYELVYDFTTGQSVPEVILTEIWNGIAWQVSERTTNTVELDPSSGLLVVGGLDEVWNDAWIPVSDFRVEQIIEDVVQTSREWDAGSQQWRFTDRTVFRSTTIPALLAEIQQLLTELVDYEDLTVTLLAFPDYESEMWFDGIGWTPAYRKTTTAFDFASGRPAVVVYEEWSGQWVESMRHEITYSAGGRPEKSKITFQGFSGPESGEDTYTYDDRGLMTESVTTWTGDGTTELVARRLLAWTELSVGTEEPAEAPSSHQLFPAYPNPFNPSTTIRYELARTDRVAISVYDVLGKRVADLVDGVQAAGRHEVVLDASGLPSGLYAVRMTTVGTSQSYLVTLLR